jgi:hypothetical protein
MNPEPPVGVIVELGIDWNRLESNEFEPFELVREYGFIDTYLYTCSSAPL